AAVTVKNRVMLEVFGFQNGKGIHRRHLSPITWRYDPHSQCYSGYFVHCPRPSHHDLNQQHQWPPLRFDSVRPLLVWNRQG
ncbi:Uncharacterized protein FKW44_013069, partial [Caligus rogercresseyi]